MLEEEKHNLAEALAHTIIAELDTNFGPTGQRKKNLVDKLHTTIPTRKELSYIQVARQDAPKQQFEGQLVCSLPTTTCTFFLPLGLTKSPLCRPSTLLQAIATYLNESLYDLEARIQTYLHDNPHLAPDNRQPSEWPNNILKNIIEKIYESPLIIIQAHDEPVAPSHADYSGDPLFVLYEAGNYVGLILHEGYDPLRILEEIFDSKEEKPTSGEEDTEKLKRLFCLAHGEFNLTSCFDIEHASPHANIRKNQMALLEYFNAKENNDFTDYFLLQPNISDYFRRDENGVVKGTAYFYKMSYNAIDNLFLLCHGCNLDKSSSSPLEWFESKEEYFGKPFIKDIETEGGLHEGVLFHRIHQVDADTHHINLGSRSAIPIPVKSIGLGQFVRNWFFKRYSDIFEQEKFVYIEHYHVFKLHLMAIMGFIQANKPDKAAKALKRFKEDTKMAKQLLGYLIRPPQQTSSGSGSSGDENVKQYWIEDATQNTIDWKLTQTIINNLHRITRRIYGVEIGTGVFATCITCNNKIMRLTGEQWDIIFNKFDILISEDAYNKSQGQPLRYTSENLIEKIQQWHLEEAEKNQLLSQRQQQLHQKEEVIQQKEEEIARLRAKIALRESSSPGSSSSSSGFFSDSSSTSPENILGQKRTYPSDDEVEHAKKAQALDHSCSNDNQESSPEDSQKFPFPR